MPAGKTDSYVTMTFDSQGRLVVSKEHDHPRRLVDADGDGVFEGEVVVSTRVRNCQGLWYDGPTLYGACNPAVPEGQPAPAEKSGLYQMPDADADGVTEGATLIAPFIDAVQEHGVHALRRGPDGALTMMIGNNTFFVDETQIDPASPFAGGRESQFLPVDPGRPRLRPQRQDRRARHGAPRRSRDEALHDRGRRLPQRLRPRLQSRGRAVHVRQRHGVGHRDAVVSRDPHGARRARRRLRLPQRIRQAAGLGPRQPAAAARRRPRIAGRGRVLSVAGLPDGDARRAARSRLVARPPALHAADAQGRELRGGVRPHRAGARRAAQHHRRRGRTGRPRLLHDRRTHHRGRRLPGRLQRARGRRPRS